jgi:TP901 family phage tail tape measure protein
MALRSVGVRLQAEVSGYTNQLRMAARSTKDFVGELDKAAKAGQLDAVADQAGRMGLGLVAAFGGAVAISAKFEKAMSEVGAVSGATAGELEQLRDAALQAGQDTAFSASEAAQAQAELAKAGLDTSQILGGALTGALDLAAAGTLDLATAADIAAKTMNVFQLEGKDVGHVADVLAAAANKSATDVGEMGEALKMGGLAANAAGMSMEETVGTLAAFADRALNGSDAGTSLKTALMMLQAPTDKAAGLMEELGIQAYDANGQFIGTTKLAGELQTALGTLTQEQRNAALAQIFGSDAMRAANVLYEVGEQGIRDYVAAVDDQGAASDMAREKTDNLIGDIERLKGSLETLAIEAGSGSAGGLRTVVQGMDNMVNSLSGIPAPAQNAAVMVAGVTGATLLAAAAAAKMRAATALAGQQLVDLGPRGEKAARGLDKASRAAGRVGIALVAMQVASALGGGLNAELEALGLHLEEFAASGQAAGEMARLFGDDMGKLDTALKDVADTGRWSSFARGLAGTIEGITGLGNAFDDSLTKSRERLQSLDDALAQMVRSGNAETAKQAFDRVAASAAEQGVSVNELKNVLPGYFGALDVAAKSAGPLAKYQQDAANTAKTLASAWETAVSEGKSLVDVFNDLNGTAIGWAEAEINVEGAARDLKEALDASNGSLNVHNEKGAAAKQSILDFAKAAADATQAKYEETGSVEAANGVYTHYRNQLITTLTQMGINKKRAQELADEYLSMPKNITTNAKFNTSSADAGITGFVKKIRGLDGKVITVYTRLTPLGDYHPGAGTATRRWGGITEHAQTGLLREAAVYSPMGPARYAFAEPATGGEAFIPKYGDRDRSLGILDKAASWYGMQVSPRDWTGYQASPAAAGGTVRVALNVRWAGHGGYDGDLGQALMRKLRYEVKLEGGGDVQVALGS